MLPGSHGHVGGVGDHDRSVHEWFSGVRVDQVWELIQHFCHLVAAPATSDVNHKLCVGILRKGLLSDRLSGTKRSWNSSCTALGEWEQEVQDTHTRHEGSVWSVLLRKDGEFSQATFASSATPSRHQEHKRFA